MKSRIFILLAMIMIAATMPAASPVAQPSSIDDALDEGRRLFLAGDYEAARARWQPLADAGDPRALYNLATLYRKGLGVARDDGAADRLLREAADSGFNDARYVLAERLFSTEGADEAKRQEAARLWLVAAAEGHGLAAYRAGLLYWNGEAVARDLVTGRAWMSRASDAGVEAAGEAILTMDRYLSEAQRAQALALAPALVTTDDNVPAPEPAGPSAAIDIAKTSTTPPASAGQVPQARHQPRPDAATLSVSDAAFYAGWRLQLVALRSGSEVEGFWRKLRDEAPDLISGIDRRIVIARVPERGEFHRLQIGPFSSRNEANQRCRALKAAGYGCFPVAPEEG